jgi:RNA polymerase sigma-70 factor (ECF subfamily)
MSASPRDIDEPEVPSGTHLAELLRGENSAWARLCREIREMLKAVARKRLRTDVEILIDPSDCVQKAMTKAYRSRPRFRGKRLVQFYSWLVRIVINQAHTDNRFWGRRTCQQLPLTKGSASDRMQPVQEAPTDPNTEIDRLFTALARLPEAQREAVRLRKLEGWSVQEIASHLNRSDEATAGLIKRGMVRLVKLMKAEKCPEGP